jgi:energy-coupling factor transporter ATP-binding protein EcfA2
MQINSLSILQFRGIQNASFRFKAGFNLIVGVNGAGKSSVLDALCIVLARALPELTLSGIYGIGFSKSDITVDRESLAISSEFTCHGNDFSITLTEQRTSSNELVNKDSGLKDIRDVDELPTMRRHERPGAGDIRLEGTLRGQTSPKPNANVLTPTPDQKLKKAPSQPLVLYLSVRRSIPNERTPSTRKNAAYQSIFNVERGLEVRTLARWWKTREVLAAEAPESKPSQQLTAVKSALQELLPSLSGWRVEGQQIFVSKTAKVSGISDAGETLLRDEVRELPLAWLSDGEKSLVAITTDIAQRLVSLNPKESNPIKSGKGIVLLDEIDLHLHPSWQREIAVKLPLVFPGLQFIATTHSPQVIGETEPGRAVVLHEGGKTEVLDESLGRDSGWILRHVMGTTERNAMLQAGLDEIDKLIEADEFHSARERIEALRARFGDDVELVGAEAAVDRWETLGREEDN